MELVLRGLTCHQRQDVPMSELPPLGPTPVVKAEARRVRGHGGSVTEILQGEATIPQCTLMFYGLPLSSVKQLKFTDVSHTVLYQYSPLVSPL